MKVLVTGVGGGIGQSILKALRGTKYEVVGIDSKVDAAGLYMVNNAYTGKNHNEEGYIDRLLEVCKKEECKYLFPGLDVELEPLSRNKQKFINIGTVPIVSDEKVIKLSNDKYALYEFLKENGFPFIKTAKSYDDIGELGMRFPLVLKPKIGGHRSKDILIVNNYGESMWGKCWHDNLMAQEYIEGGEYTCGSITFDGKVYGTIAMRRKLRDGDTYKAYVEKHRIINAFLCRLLEKIKPFGPCNVQLRMKDNIPYVFEINARCSGTTAARALAGFNEPEMTCKFLEGIVPEYDIKQIVILRYWNEQVVTYEEIGEMKYEGYINRS